MEHRRINQTPVGLLILVCIFALASSGYAQNDSGASGGGQETPEELLKTCKELVQKRDLSRAESYCNRVIDKGGTSAAEAQEVKKQILTRRNCELYYYNAIELSSRRLCPKAIGIRQEMQLSCSDYSGLGTLDTVLQSQCPASQRPPELEEGIGLFNKKDYRRAQKVFEGLERTHPDLIELQTYLKNTEVEISVENCRAYLKRGDSGLASEQLKKLTELAPEDPRIPNLREQVQVLSSSRQRDQGKDRGGAEDAPLDKAIHEFYAGHFSQADQMLDQYLGQPNKHKPLAFFFRGAIACTDYFLGGAKDEQKQALARDFFSKAHQADEKFSPPRIYISPKILDVYEKTAAGS